MPRTYAQASRLLWFLLATAFVVSIVHYLDNYVNYDEYPLPPADSSLPVPSATLVGLSWFGFTASGIFGIWFWLGRHLTAAAWALGAYSLSGLIGFGHYTSPGAFDMPWWRQTHVVADLICGIAIASFAVWAARTQPE